MDVINHFTQSCILAVPTNNNKIIIVSGLLGTVPDVLGEIAARVYDDGYKLYDDIHFGKLMWLGLIPQVGLHILEDHYSHREYAYLWMPLNIFFWMVDVFLITMIIVNNV